MEKSTAFGDDCPPRHVVPLPLLPQATEGEFLPCFDRGDTVKPERGATTNHGSQFGTGASPAHRTPPSLRDTSPMLAHRGGLIGHDSGHAERKKHGGYMGATPRGCLKGNLYE